MGLAALAPPSFLLRKKCGYRLDRADSPVIAGLNTTWAGTFDISVLEMHRLGEGGPLDRESNKQAVVSSLPFVVPVDLVLYDFKGKSGIFNFLTCLAQSYGHPTCLPSRRCHRSTTQAEVDLPSSPLLTRCGWKHALGAMGSIGLARCLLLVYDPGGGTFDISILEMKDSEGVLGSGVGSCKLSL